MKILFCKWGSVCDEGIGKAIKRAGYELVEFTREYNSVDYDKEYMLALVDVLQMNRDCNCVISTNYIPIVSRATKPFGIPYISLVVDSPCNTLYSKTLAYQHNRVFSFDRVQYEKFVGCNPENVFHMPLATDVQAYDNIQLSKTDIEKYSCDVSFVGSLYTERCKYDGFKHKLPDRMKGYVDGLVNAQLAIQGYNFMEEAITSEWAEEFRKAANLSSFPADYENDMRGVIANHYIGVKCTAVERVNTLKSISDKFACDIYTASDTSMLENIHNRGIADTNTMMPKIFKCSKINLNITLRSIKSGIPLRVFDVLGCGGFLISNYQEELAECFVSGEEIVIYDSILDLLEKIEYYLAHDEERQRIAKNGYKKVKEYYTYDLLLENMLERSGVK